MAGGKKKPIVVAQIMGKMNGGGVEAVIMNYYRHIDRTKIQFDFICDEDSTNIPYEEIEKLGGKVILCPPYQKLHKYMKFLENLFVRKKYRIIHSNINTLSVFPLKAAKKAGVPVRIAHSHNTSNPREIKRNLVKNVLRKFSKKYATDYFACSEAAGRYQFGDKAFDEGKVKIIPNAINIEKFKYDPDARKKLRKEIGIKDSDFVIGHVGAFRRQKNHTFLIDVFAEVKKERKNAKLILVGQGPLREEIEEKVKKLGLEKDVFFLGQRNDTNKLYSVFDVFCLPSLYEGFGVVTIEACAAERNVILSEHVPRNKVLVGAQYKKLKIKEWTNALNTIAISNNAKRLINAEDYNLEIQSKNIEKKYIDKYINRIIVFCEKWQNGGIESYLSKTLPRIGNENKITLVIGQKETTIYDKYIGCDNITTHTLHEVINNPIKRTVVNFASFRKYIKNEKNAVVYINIYNSLGQIYALMAHKNKKVLIHAHNNGIDANNDRLHIKRIANSMAKLLLGKGRYEYLACSHEAAEFCYRKKYANRSKIIINGINENEFSYNDKTRKRIRRKYKISNQEIVLGNIGRFVEQKNHIFMIKLLEELKQTDIKARLLLVGKGPLRNLIEQTAKEKELLENITFIDETDNAGDLYSAMDIFIFPSLYEGQGIVLIEAQCEGLPCIASSAVPKLTKISENVEYLDLDISKWANKIEELLKKDDTRKSVSVKGTDYDIEKTANAIEGIATDSKKDRDINHLVTLVIPAYNVEEYIAPCLESALRQTYNNIEIVIIDDGSTDDTSAICDEYEAKFENIKLIHKKNGGLASARNCGLRYAKGEYVAFLDGDDELDETAVEKMVHCAKTYKADIVACNFYFDKRTNIPNKKHKVSIYRKEDALKAMTNLKSGFAPNVCNKLFKRDLFSNDCLFPSGKLYEDIIVTTKAVCKSNIIAYLEEGLYYYRTRPNSITRHFNTKEFDHIEMSREVLDYIEKTYPSVMDYFIAYHAVNQLSVINKMIVSDHNDLLVVDNYIEYIRSNKNTIMSCKGLSTKKKIQCILPICQMELYKKAIRVLKK